MSWYVNITGTPGAVARAVSGDGNTPLPIKQCVADLAKYFPEGELLTVETQGHFDTSATPPTGNATLIFRVQKFAKEPVPPPNPPQDTATVIAAS